MIEEHHPAGYAYAARFADLRAVGGAEGGGWYAGTEDGRPALVSDEGTLADLLGDDELAFRAVCVRVFDSEAERTRYLQARLPAAHPGRSETPATPATHSMQLTKGRDPICTPDEWFRLAPPKGGAAQWVTGRSALECALAWCGDPAGPAVPGEIRALLDSHPDTRGCSLTAATPEHPIAFDDLPGERRNADVVVLGADARGTVAVTVEAKADEPFDRYVADVLAEAVDRSAHGDHTNLVRRIEQLAAALLPPGQRGLPGLGQLRYQLLTGVAGTLAYAAEVGAARAVFVVHEFITPATRDDRHEANDADLATFLRRLSGGADRDLRAGQLVGPFQVRGAPRFAHPAALYTGKAQRRLRTPGV